ncbi:MAG: DUF4226 domain-containing protein, partial [Mycobacterium sp.]
MTAQSELHDAVRRIGQATDNPIAWTTGLSPQDIAVVGLVVVPDADAAAVLAKIKANHPALFESGVGAPVVAPATPPPQPGREQAGAGVTAIHKAESDLAHQNSRTAQVDLLVVTAILNAHTTADRGGAELDRLQAQIEGAVRTRTDLDTPAGARDFQRYLIGKLREIGAVVETASLDDRSKATLAAAWTALYEASRTSAGSGDTPNSSAAATDSSVVHSPAAAAAPLPPYGGDLGADPLLEQLLAQDPFGGGAAGGPA